jgi:nucleotide-binding universal stress UspA family protein
MRPLSLRTILVATDLSEAMLPALQTARQLSELAASQLHVVHGSKDPVPRARIRQHLASEKLDEIAEARAVEAPASATIIQEALRLKADVIVLGPHRPNRTDSLGSTADRVVRIASSPCLILPRALPLPLGHVLVPVAASESARGALAVALTWASALRRRSPSGASTRVVALHVTEPGSSNSDAVQHLAREVDAVRERLATLAGVNIEQLIEESKDPADAILKHSGDADLVVLGSRGLRRDHG